LLLLLFDYYHRKNKPKIHRNKKISAYQR